MTCVVCKQDKTCGDCIEREEAHCKECCDRETASCIVTPRWKPISE